MENEKVICADCHYFNFRDAMKRMVKFAESGMGNCAFDNPASYYNARFKRHCAKFDEAALETRNKRQLFLIEVDKQIEEKLNGKSN